MKVISVKSLKNDWNDTYELYEKQIRRTKYGRLFICTFYRRTKGWRTDLFSISMDGLHWEDLNDGQPVLYSHLGMQGVRDPFLLRDPKQKKFYLIATDLRIEAGEGWDTAQYRGSRDLIVWESKDLVHWSAERASTIGVPGAGCVWAPEGIYDSKESSFWFSGHLW